MIWFSNIKKFTWIRHRCIAWNWIVSSMYRIKYKMLVNTWMSRHVLLNLKWEGGVMNGNRRRWRGKGEENNIWEIHKCIRTRYHLTWKVFLEAASNSAFYDLSFRVDLFYEILNCSWINKEDFHLSNPCLI